MKKHLISAVVLTAMTVGQAVPVIALAGTSPSPSRTPNPVPSMRQEYKERRQELREEGASKSRELQQEFKDRLSELRKGRIKNWLRRMQKRLGALIDRQYKLAEKIGKKLDRAAEAGKDVTALRTQLAEAKTKIDAAKKALEDMTAQVEDILEENPPREAFAKIHELQKDVFGKIREAHQALVKVLAAMRGLSATPTPTSTPSPSVSPTP
jgi:chromosome segregation ATPase